MTKQTNNIPAHSILLTESEMESIIDLIDEAVEINDAERTNEELDNLSELRTGLDQALELIREGYMYVIEDVEIGMN